MRPRGNRQSPGGYLPLCARRSQHEAGAIQSSKIIAFTLLGEDLICDRACYSTQIKDISVCLERTAEDSLMFTNQMRIRSELDSTYNWQWHWKGYAAAIYPC